MTVQQKIVLVLVCIALGIIVVTSVEFILVVMFWIAMGYLTVVCANVAAAGILTTADLSLTAYRELRAKYRRREMRKAAQPKPEAKPFVKPAVDACADFVTGTVGRLAAKLRWARKNRPATA